MAAKSKTLWLLAVLLVLCASSAFASIPKPDIALQPGYEEKLELFTDEAPAEIAWPVIDVATFEWLDEVSHVEIDLANDEPLTGEVELFDTSEDPSLFAVKEKLASGVLGSGAENNVSSISELVEKMGWGEDIHAYPFVEPANGKVYARARWYDPQTGTFMSPDPMGYQDSSNMYAFCGGDPINCSDPTGEFGDGGDVRNDFRQKEQKALAERDRVWCSQHPAQCRQRDVRGKGIVRMVGGGVQVFGGAVAGSSTGPIPEPVTKGFAITNIVRGVDNFGAGLMETITGDEYDTLFGRTLYLSLLKAGVEPAKASKISGYTEVAVDVVAGVGAGVIGAVNKPAAASKVLHASQIKTLAPAAEGTDTVVLGPYAVRTTMNGREVIIDSERTLTEVAVQLRGRTLTNYSRDPAILAEQIRKADRIVFYTRPGVMNHPLTAGEMQLIQSDPALRAKTVFVYGGID
jgi:RHS repeat-associated protein